MKFDSIEEVRLYIVVSLIMVFIVITGIVIWHSKMGDLNNDFDTSITDLVKLGFMIEAGQYDWRADYNKDGFLTEYDFCVMSAYLAEFKDGEFVCNE